MNRGAWQTTLLRVAKSQTRLSNIHTHKDSPDCLELECVCVCVCVQLGATLYNPKNCSLPGSSVHGIFQARIWSRLPFPPPRDLPDPVIEPMSLASTALAGRFITA